MKLITPPKATPCAQSAAASGMLPTEQTKERTASSGATITFSSTVQTPWPLTKRCDHHRFGHVDHEEARDDEAGQQFLAQHREVARW